MAERKLPKGELPRGFLHLRGDIHMVDQQQIRVQAASAVG